MRTHRFLGVLLAAALGLGACRTGLLDLEPTPAPKRRSDPIRCEGIAGAPCPEGERCIIDADCIANGWSDCQGTCTHDTDNVLPCKWVGPSECAERSECASMTCPLCQPDLLVEICYTKGGTPPACSDPSLTCAPSPPRCDAHVDAASCDADLKCRAVFDDAGDCSCTRPGCCLAFKQCAEGAEAFCSPLDPGAPPGPNCLRALTCGDELVLSYSADGCVWGCVALTKCGPSPAE